MNSLEPSTRHKADWSRENSEKLIKLYNELYKSYQGDLLWNKISKFFKDQDFNVSPRQCSDRYYRSNPGRKNHRWKTIEDGTLLESVTKCIQAYHKIVWNFVYEDVANLLPGISLKKCQQRYAYLKKTKKYGIIDLEETIRLSWSVERDACLKNSVSKHHSILDWAEFWKKVSDEMNRGGFSETPNTCCSRYYQLATQSDINANFTYEPDAEFLNWSTEIEDSSYITF